jgi:cell division protein FtsI (penicillin-binding protein 3)
MRKMMEGVVLFGTGKPAQLNGYSSGGKTGTAQKVDPVTHLYSKTMHVASFAGIAPVNNPVIAVAVIMDNPKGVSYYGTAVSAPVFAEVAQQVLEYLNVPHDVDVHAAKTTGKPTGKPEKPLQEDDADADQNQVNALFAAVNDLPADDPLRQPAAPAQVAVVSALLPAASDAQSNSVAANPTASTQLENDTANPPPQYASTQVTISDGKKLSVPSLLGLPVRKVIELTAAAGLTVQINGSGTVREQAPVAGTLVPTGTKIVVRCGR